MLLSRGGGRGWVSLSGSEVWVVCLRWYDCLRKLGEVWEAFWCLRCASVASALLSSGIDIEAAMQAIERLLRSRRTQRAQLPSVRREHLLRNFHCDCQNITRKSDSITSCCSCIHHTPSTRHLYTQEFCLHRISITTPPTRPPTRSSNGITRLPHPHRRKRSPPSNRRLQMEHRVHLKRASQTHRPPRSARMHTHANLLAQRDQRRAVECYLGTDTRSRPRNPQLSHYDLQRLGQEHLDQARGRRGVDATKKSDYQPVASAAHVCASHGAVRP